jgi:hypothetical protein
MWYAAVCVLGLGQTSPPPADYSPLLAGTWRVNGNGFLGDLVIRLGPNGRIEGSFYGQPMTGSFDAHTNRVTIRRLRDAQDRAGVQLYTGLLSRVANTDPPRFNLEGTFKSIAGQAWGKEGVEYLWKAQEVKLPTPAQDLRALQGRWEVARVLPARNPNLQLPAETRLVNGSGGLVIRGNELTWHGNVLATLANELPSAALNAEKGLKQARLLVLTLPDGRALVCSYTLRAGGVELAYPHTTADYRGSGQIIYLRRPGT